MKDFASHKQERWVPNNDLKNHIIQPRNAWAFQIHGRKTPKIYYKNAIDLTKQNNLLIWPPMAYDSNGKQEHTIHNE